MLKSLIDEFNCHHQADLSDSNSTSTIYNREDEHKVIKDFLKTNITKKKSGLMYLCGHPGTGKTSSLNFVMQEIMRGDQLKFRPLLFNAMTYPDVKSFCIVLYERLFEEFYGKPCVRKLNRNHLDDEELASLIERLLVKIEESGNRFGGDSVPHRVIVIDEVDSFYSNEKHFTALIR
jgi:Cdc6-like AAA superfamily ATPase